MTPQATLPSVANLTEEFTSKLDKRLEELQPFVNEYTSLTDMRTRVTGKGIRTRAQNDGRAPRARQGGRMEEFLQIVKDTPGITVSQAAEKMGVAPNYLYRLRKEAEGENKLRREDSQLFPVG